MKAFCECGEELCLQHGEFGHNDVIRVTFDACSRCAEEFGEEIDEVIDRADGLKVRIRELERQIDTQNAMLGGIH